MARGIVLFPVMIAGAWVGVRLFHGLASERLYRNVALVILLATGLFGLLRQLACGVTSTRVDTAQVAVESRCTLWGWRSGRLQDDKRPRVTGQAVGNFPKQAVVVIHGIGEQKPNGHDQEFRAAAWRKDQRPSLRNNRTPMKIWSKPDTRTGSLELRRLTTASDRATDAPTSEPKKEGVPAGLLRTLLGRPVRWLDLGPGEELDRHAVVPQPVTRVRPA